MESLEMVNFKAMVKSNTQMDQNILVNLNKASFTEKANTSSRPEQVIQDVLKMVRDMGKEVISFQMEQYMD